MIEVMLALTCQLVGVDPTQPNGQCLGVDQQTGKIGFLPTGNLEKGEIGGAIGGMNNMIAMLYTPPIHTSDYFQHLASNFGIVKNAQAQTTGTGFEGLKPLLNLWTAFRNIVYLLFVIVFVAIGLAIMLRIKVDPRTVMSIQNQIPKIIIGILLVTFSFAIAGFLVDLMWVVIYLVFGLISGISGDIATSVSGLNPAALQGTSPLGVQGFGGIASITWNAGNSILGSVTNLLGLGLLDLSFMNILIHAMSVGAGFFVAFFTEGFKVAGFSIPGVQEAIKGGAAAVLVEAGLRWAIPYTIAYLVIFIALLIALFRLWFSLLMAYINILIDVVLAPFWIVGSLVPGSPVSAVGWLRDIIANLAAFPAVIAMFLLGKVFMHSFGKTPASGQNFVPPLIGNPGDVSAIGALIGLGIILMTPNVVSMVKAALKAPKFDSGLGKAISGGTGIFGIPGKVGQLGLMIGGMKNVRDLIPGRKQANTRQGPVGGTPAAGGAGGP